MKLCSFRADGRASYGLVTENSIVDLGRRYKATTLREFIASGEMSTAASLVDEPADFAFDAVEHDPVIPNPDKIICVGLNYHDHISETGREETPFPVLFARFSGSQIGHGEPLVKPLESDKFDYEGELAVIIGRECRRVPEDQALEMVAGYACYNDGSVRDWQKHTHQFMPGKTFAGTGPFGPGWSPQMRYRTPRSCTFRPGSTARSCKTPRQSCLSHRYRASSHIAQPFFRCCPAM
jgi:2-keto-4-pentenoate hydratase/2-oxohepta-3-ene-1,7-dioic acid hydratase in catechol pathway